MQISSSCVICLSLMYTLDLVQRKNKNRKATGLNEILLEEWKTTIFNDILLRYYNAVFNQNTIDRWTKVCILLFPKKGDLGLAKNYRGITLTYIGTKIYNFLLCNRIKPKIEKILMKNQNGFRRNRSTTSQILTICQIRECVRAKNLEAIILFVDFSKIFHSIQRGKMEQILLAYDPRKETVAAIKMLFRNSKVNVRSPGWRHKLLQHCSRDSARRHICSYLFIIYLDYVLRTFIDKMKDNGFKLTKERS